MDLEWVRIEAYSIIDMGADDEALGAAVCAVLDSDDIAGLKKSTHIVSFS